MHASFYFLNKLSLFLPLKQCVWIRSPNLTPSHNRAWESTPITWEVDTRGSEAAQGHPQQYTDFNTDLPSWVIFCWFCHIPDYGLGAWLNNASVCFANIFIRKSSWEVSQQQSVGAQRWDSSSPVVFLSLDSLSSVPSEWIKKILVNMY